MTKHRVTLNENTDGTFTINVGKRSKTTRQRTPTSAGRAYPACLALLVAVAWAVLVYGGKVW